MKTFLKVTFCLALSTILIFLILIALFPPIKPFPIYVLLFGFSLLPVLIFLIGIQRLFCWGIQSTYKNFNGKSLPKSISLSLVTFLFISTINKFIKSLIILSISLGINISSNFTREWQGISSTCDNIFAFSGISNLWQYLSHLSDFFSTECFSEIFMGVLNVWISSVNTAYIEAEILSLPFGRLLILVAVYVLFVKLVEQFINSNNNSSNETIANFNNWLSGICSNPRRDNIIFFSLLSFGVYLSIASIATIPSLENSKNAPSAVSIEKFRQEIQDSIDSFKKRFSVDTTNNFEQLRSQNPFDKLEKDLIEEREKDLIKEKEKALRNQKERTINNEIEKDLDNEIEEINNQEEEILDNEIEEINNQEEEILNDEIEEINNQEEEILNDEIKQTLDEIEFKEKNYKKIRNLLDNLEQDRNKVLDQGSQMFANYQVELDRRGKSVTNKYEFGSVSRKGDRETAEHFILLTTWLNNYISLVENKMNSCLSDIVTFDSASKTIIAKINSDLSKNNNIELFSGIYSTQNQKADESLSEAYFSCQSNTFPRYEPIPERPELGSYLGVFRFVASWLLRTESLDLSLITGLIGFGLLGSACSSFVRERLEPSEKLSINPLVQDLPKVIVIGLSAAILAFLAVMGGLAVFFSSSNNPNPYALLLSCLVAAAFGEDVWQWAREKMKKQIQDGGKKSSGTDSLPAEETVLSVEDDLDTPSSEG